MHLVLQQKFLKSFARYGIIKTAAQAAGVDRSTVWRWREGDPAFAEAYAAAAQEAVDVLERAAWGRAVQGVRQPDGSVKHSDALLTFLLKARDPARFGDLQRVQVRSQVAVDAQLRVAAEEGTEQLSPEEIQRLSRFVLTGGLDAAGTPERPDPAAGDGGPPAGP